MFIYIVITIKRLKIYVYHLMNTNNSTHPNDTVLYVCGNKRILLLSISSYFSLKSSSGCTNCILNLTEPP